MKLSFAEIGAKIPIAGSFPPKPPRFWATRGENCALGVPGGGHPHPPPPPPTGAALISLISPDLRVNYRAGGVPPPPAFRGCRSMPPKCPKIGIFGGALDRDSARAEMGQKAAVWGLWRKEKRIIWRWPKRGKIGVKKGGLGQRWSAGFGEKMGGFGYVPPPAGTMGGKKTQIKGKTPKSRGKKPKSRRNTPKSKSFACWGGVAALLERFQGLFSVRSPPPPPRRRRGAVTSSALHKRASAGGGAQTAPRRRYRSGRGGGSRSGSAGPGRGGSAF